MKKSSKVLISIIGGLLFVIILLGVKFIDVKQIGPQGTSVGLATINKFVFDILGTNLYWYEITDILGILALMVAFVFAVIGFIQFVKRKSLFKVDREIIVLGVFYIVVIAIYVLFELVVINYRPIIMPGNSVVEASFPSSHTMLVITVMGSAFIAMNKYINNKVITTLLKIVCIVIIVVTVVGRLICGVHWFSDILAGVFISIMLLSLLSIFYNK